MSIKPHDKSVFKLFENFKILCVITKLALVFFIFHALIVAWVIYQIVIEMGKILWPVLRLQERIEIFKTCYKVSHKLFFFSLIFFSKTFDKT